MKITYRSLQFVGLTILLCLIRISITQAQCSNQLSYTSPTYSANLSGCITSISGKIQNTYLSQISGKYKLFVSQSVSQSVNTALSCLPSCTIYGSGYYFWYIRYDIQVTNSAGVSLGSESLIIPCGQENTAQLSTAISYQGDSYLLFTVTPRMEYWFFNACVNTTGCNTTSSQFVASLPAQTFYLCVGTPPPPPPPPPPPTPAPTVSNFSIAPSTVIRNSGAMVTFSWSSTNASATYLENVTAGNATVGSGFGGGNVTYSTTAPTATTTYRVRATGAGGTAYSESKTVTVNDPPPTIVSFDASNYEIASGGSSFLTWEVSFPTSSSNNVTISNVSPSSQPFVSSTPLEVRPTSNTTYTLTANSASGSVSRQLTITVSSSPPPPQQPFINIFGASPNPVPRGQPTLLTWSVNSATTSVSITGIGTVTPTAGGSKTVYPVNNTVYTLTAYGASGTTPVSQSTSVNVTTPIDLTLTDPVSVPPPYSASNSVVTQNFTINAGASVDITAGQFVSLRPTTSLKSGSTVHIRINSSSTSRTENYIFSPHNDEPETDQLEKTEAGITNVILYPNPSTGDVKIQIPGNMKVQQLKILTLLGSEILTMADDLSAQPTITLNLRHLNKGIYLVHLYVDGGLVIKRLILE